ncbi:hypothetical protein Ctob_014761, partial [Chrysochromulina tobinii]
MVRHGADAYEAWQHCRLFTGSAHGRHVSNARRTTDIAENSRGTVDDTYGHDTCLANSQGYPRSGTGWKHQGRVLACVPNGAQEGHVQVRCG